MTEKQTQDELIQSLKQTTFAEYAEQNGFEIERKFNMPKDFGGEEVEVDLGEGIKIMSKLSERQGSNPMIREKIKDYIFLLPFAKKILGITIQDKNIIINFIDNNGTVSIKKISYGDSKLSEFNEIKFFTK